MSPEDRSAPTGADAGGLACERVRVTLAGVAVLPELSLEVAAADLTVLVGPSGAGKTTLVRAIAGLTTPETGRIRLAGREIAHVAAHRRRVGVVFQQPRLFPNLDVGENVAFAPRLSRTPRTRRRERAVGLLDEVGLAGFERRSVRSLSGGEQQRVALARALSADPELLLLDEPLAAVDPNRRQSLRGLIRRIQRERSLTCLYVTHDREEAAELGDRLALMLEGRIVQHGPPEDFFERPRDPVVARFFGSRNLLSGVVTGGRLPLAGTAVPVPGPDGAATLTIRPERVRLHPRLADGLVVARVTAATYLGAACRIELDVDGEPLEALVPPAVTPATGARVGVELPVDDLWRFPEPGPGALAATEASTDRSIAGLGASAADDRAGSAP